MNAPSISENDEWMSETDRLSAPRPMGERGGRLRAGIAPAAPVVEISRLHNAALSPRTLMLGEFLDLQLPPRVTMLTPIFAEKSINMIFAPRGIGKTYLALSIAYALGTGGNLLRWQSDRPRRVLIIDGEMPAAALQERLREIADRQGNRSYADLNIGILAADLFEAGLPDLSTVEGQEALAPYLNGFDLIIADNISTLARTGRENESESWGRLQEWSLTQRRAGRSVLWLHHAGKGGEQRGTSKREDVMDTVIKLSHPSDYSPTEGARFIIEFTKARGFMGDGAEAFEAQLSDGVWTHKSATDARTARIMALHSEGNNQRDIATEVGCSAPTVNRTIKRASLSGGA
jgi:putative DNA primase/helicase